MRILGVRSSPEKVEEAHIIQEAVQEEILKRRKKSDSQAKPASTQEHRSLGRKNILQIVKDFQGSLQQWEPIVLAARNGKPNIKLEKLPHSEDFIDGFLINVDKKVQYGDLVQKLKSLGLDTNSPIQRVKPGEWWIYILGGPWDLKQNQPKLRLLVDEFSRKKTINAGCS